MSIVKKMTFISMVLVAGTGLLSAGDNIADHGHGGGGHWGGGHEYYGGYAGGFGYGPQVFINSDGYGRGADGVYTEPFFYDYSNPYQGNGNYNYNYQYPYGQYLNQNEQPKSDTPNTMTPPDQRAIAMNAPAADKTPTTAMATPPTNDEVVARVRAILKSDTSLSNGARIINISADAGKVTLTGNVANQAEKNKVETVVKQINGVKTVVNRLEVSSK